jgi:DNA-binding GntR family transcriptional regulator
MVESSSSTPYVRTLEQTSMVEQVTNELRRSILSGALKPGQQFSLREVAGQLGVSFIPVREALRQLEAQGLIVTRVGKSASVAPLDPDDLHAIYRLRRQLEPEIAIRSCRLLEEPDFAKLAVLVEMFGDEAKGIDEIYDAHHSFHLELLRPAATAWDLRTLEGLWHAGERYIRVAFGHLDSDPDEHRRRQRVHCDLLEAFRRGDPQEVAEAVRHHLDDNERIAQTALSPVRV